MSDKQVTLYRLRVDYDGELSMSKASAVEKPKSYKITSFPDRYWGTIVRKDDIGFVKPKYNSYIIYDTDIEHGSKLLCETIISEINSSLGRVVVLRKALGKIHTDGLEAEK